MHACALSRVQLFATPGSAVFASRQALLPMGFSRQECWSGLPFPSPGDLPNPGIESSKSLLSPALAGRFFTTVPSGKPQITDIWYQRGDIIIDLLTSKE